MKRKRKRLPDLKGLKVDKGEKVIFHNKEKGLTLAIVKDKREFFILSTFDSCCELSDVEPKKR
jgi:hypothetical protein